MFAFSTVLAEIIPQGGPLWDHSGLPGGQAAAALFFILILCAGVALELALVLYFVKRPSRPAEWGKALEERALPGRTVLLLLLPLVLLFLGCSTAYSWLFDRADQLMPHTLVFQMVAFQLPAVLILAGVFFFHRRAFPARTGARLQRIPALLGLSVLLYLAAVPILWFYSALCQFVLYRFGFDLHLQDVVEIFRMPSPPLERVAMYLAAIIGAPLFEEALFRGVLLPWVIRRAGFWPGVAAVSLLFAGMHFHLPSFLPLFLFSGMLCIAYARTRSLLVPIGMHACFNAVTVILLTLAG